MTQTLPASIQQNTGNESNLRVGIVQSVDSAISLTVNIGGGIIDSMPFLASYSPSVGDNVQIARFDATWLVLGIVGNPGLTVINGVITSSTTNVVTSGTTESDLPFLSSQTPVVVRAGHIYEFHAFCITAQSVNVDLFEWRARRDTALTGTEIAFQRFSNTTSANSWGQEVTVAIEFTADDTFSLFWSMVRITGTGTVTASPTLGVARAYMKVTDMGLNTSVSGSPWSVTT